MKHLFNKRTLIAAGIAILTFICYRYTLHNQFTNWDDDVYVSNDQYIRALTKDNIKTIFTEDITKNNYHPFCMLSLALNYHFAAEFSSVSSKGGLEPETYYLTNILIHIANALLVFFLFTKICAKLKIEEQGSLFISGFGALWFAVHPMHVESVSWIAERKDVLYAFFYLLGLITYIRFLNEGKSKWYWITFVLFICSCLSKPMAVVFPLSLVCFDFVFEGKLSKKSILQKAPFFVAAFLCGALAVYTQNKTGAIAPFSALTIQERVMYAAYGFVMYITKLIFPYGFSTFYPYPYRYVSGWLPFIYYAAPLIAIALIALPLWYTYKKNKDSFRMYAFGIGYFTSNIIFVLQLISCGSAIMADRYSYVSSVGLLFIIPYFIWLLIKKLPALKNAIIVILLVLSAGLSYGCYERTMAWHNSETLLTDAIQKYPYRALLSYKWLGNYYMDNGRLDKALENYNVLAMLNAADAKIYDNIGNIYKQQKDYSHALEAFGKSLGKQNNVAKTYIDLAITYSMVGDSSNALRNYALAFRIDPGSEKTYSEAGFNMVQNKQYSAALMVYNNLLLLDTKDPFYFFYRGVAEFGQNNMKAASVDWRIAAKSPVQDVGPVAAYNLSVALDSLKNDSAYYFASMAQSRGYKVDPDYMNKLKGESLRHK